MWQLFDGGCHSRHWWQDVLGGSITAMNLLPFLLTVLVVLALAYVVFALVHLLSSDGAHLRHRVPPRSHHTDPFEPHRFA